MRFERAKNYDEFATAQKKAAADLSELLTKQIHAADKIYEIGCGSGIFTQHILKEISFKELTLNDLYKSLPMEKYPSQIGDICTLEIPKNLNLIVSSSVLQWIDDLNSLFQKIDDSLFEKGMFAFAMFTNGTLFELERFTHQGLAYKTPDEICSLLKNHFEILDSKENFCTLQFENLFALLDSLKQTGVNNLDGNFHLTKSNFKELEKSFDGKFNLTYRYLVVVCKKIN